MKQMSFWMMAVAMLMASAVYANSAISEDLIRYLQECRAVAMDAEYDAKDLVRSPLTSQEVKKTFEVRFADANYVSYHAECYSYTGGAHGMTTTTVGTLDRKTGRKMAVADFVPAEKMAVLEHALREGAIQQLGSADDLLGEVKAVENFYFANDGLHFVYNPYEIACYAKGTIEVVFDLKTLR